MAHPPALFSSRTLRTSYLLVSYPLSVLGPLTLFRSAPFRTGLQELASSTAHPVLLMYGAADQFTGISKYRPWADDLKGRTPSATVTATEVEGADHFWSGRRSALCEFVDAWLEGNATRQNK